MPGSAATKDPVILDWHERMEKPEWNVEFNWLMTKERVRQWVAGEAIHWEKCV